MARSDKMLQPHLSLLSEDQNPKAILNLSKIKSRMSKQFKDTLFDSSEAVNNDANVAMSLVDALQNWADALEAQISMMRVEVLELKTSNRKLTKEVSDLKSENVQTKTQLETLGQSFMQFKGKLEMNVTKLNMKNEDVKQDVFRLNSMVAGNVNALQTQANMTLSMQEQMINMATSVNELQGTVENTTHTFALGLHHLTEMSTYNSTLLQRGFFGLEKHFIETKRKIFETQLQLVSVNSTLKTIGDLRAEVLVIGQSMANTTLLVAGRFDDLSSTNMAIQDSLAKMWNLTDQLDNKLNKLQTNHTFVSGIFKTGLKDVVAKQDLFEIQLEQKILNKTISLESAVGSLLNYTLDLDTNFMTLKANISMANRRIERVFELYEMQGKRVAENANVIKENVTNLMLAANILEAELSRVASSYAGLKNALSRHISNTGKETIYTKLVLMLL